MELIIDNSDFIEVNGKIYHTAYIALEGINPEYIELEMLTRDCSECNEDVFYCNEHREKWNGYWSRLSD